MNNTKESLVEEEKEEEVVINNVDEEVVINNVDEEELFLLPCLNEDILIEIILKTPTNSLFKSLRYVCKPWYKFINNHPGIPLNRLLCSKPPCLIIQTDDHSSPKYRSSVSALEYIKTSNYPTSTTRFIKIGMEGCIEEDFDLTPLFKSLFILACCNGIMLATPGAREMDTTILYLVNPLTNQLVILPPPDVYYHHPPQLIFLRSTREYKVVLNTDNTTQKYVQILTFSYRVFSVTKVDDEHDFKWRHVQAPRNLESQPLAINESLYWIQGYDEDIGQHILSFNAVDETFYSILHPFSRKILTNCGGFIDMGGYLAFWCIPSHSMASHLKDTKLDMWILKDFNSGEWSKQYSGVIIDTNFIKPGDDYIRLVCSHGNGEVLIFINHRVRILCAYNVKTKQWWNLQKNFLEGDYVRFYGFHVHNILDLESLCVLE